MNIPELPHLSIVIPFFNEEDAAPVLIEEVRQALQTLPPAEVLLINDGSSDGTGAMLDRIASGWPAVRVFHFAKNHGQGAGLYFGIHQAVGKVVVLLDGDGQNDPADIPVLLEALAGADFVTGIRAKRNDSVLRRSMSRIANWVRSRVLLDGVRDSGCGLKLFRREVREAFIPMRTLYSFLPAMTRAAGYTIAERPVGHRPRTRGTSKYGLWVMLWRPMVDMVGMAWFIRRRTTSPGRIGLEGGPN